MGNKYMIVFSNNLEELFGSTIRISNGSEWGIVLSPEFQKYNKILNKMVHIFKIIDEQKANQCALEKPDDIQIKTELEANQTIDDYFEDDYIVYNEGIMNANLNQMISRGQIDLDEMDATWTQDQEAEWLYKKGVSGIRRVMPNYLNDEYVSSRPEVVIEAPVQGFTKADFMAKYFTKDGWAMLEKIANVNKSDTDLISEYPTQLTQELLDQYRNDVIFGLKQFDIMTENFLVLSDSRVYDMILLADVLGILLPPGVSSEILAGVTRIEKTL